MRPALLALLFTGLAQPAQVKLPPFQRQVLDNGAVVYLMPRKDVPLATVRVLVKGGAESDPAEAAGLAEATANLLRRGTQKRTADQFSDEIDAIGATFFASSNEQASVVSSEFLSKDAARALDLLADVVLRPAFPEAEVKKELAQRIDASRSMKDQPGRAVAQYFQAFLFGPEYPYGRVADELSLKRIDRKQIVDCHGRMYVGRNLIIVAAGDFDSEAMGGALAKAFGAAPAGAAYKWREDRRPPPAQSPRLLLVDKPDATQTYFQIGHPGITRTHPDRVPVWLVNTLFGGRFTSMLNDELRVNSGLTYGAFSHFDEDRLTGSFLIHTYTRTDTTGKAMDMALDILKRLREKGIDAEQLASAKAYLKGTYPSERLETADQLASVLGELELFGLGRGEIDGLFARLDAVTLEQANAAAKKHFGAEALTFAVVGQASKIRDVVKKYAPSVIEIPVTKPGFAAR